MLSESAVWAGISLPDPVDALWAALPHRRQAAALHLRSHQKDLAREGKGRACGLVGRWTSETRTGVRA